MRGISRRWPVLAIALALFAISVADVSAAISFCPFGSGVGQCKRPSGVAVDNSNGHVFVADRGGDKIAVFDANGTFLGTPGSFGVSGTGPGQLSGPASVAIDNDPLSPAFRDVYVVDNGLRVQRFGPAGEFKGEFATAQIHDASDRVAVGPGGTVFLADNASIPPSGEFTSKIFRFSAAGTLLGASSLPGVGLTRSMAIDSAGDAYVVRNGGTGTANGGIEKYEATEPQATLLFGLAGGSNTTAVALDGADNLYAAQSEGSNRVITKYDSGGTPVSRFGYGEIERNVSGLAVAAAGDGVFAGEEVFSASGEGAGSKVIFIPLPSPGPISCCVETSSVSNTKATVKGQVNPEGKATTYHFEYVDQASFDASGFATAKSSPATPVGEDVSIHDVSVVIGCPTPTVPPQANCLTPETKYHFRLVATNSDAPAGILSEEGTLVTKQPLEILETFSTEVGPDSAQLHAVANPLGIPATGYFEFIDETSFNIGEFAGATQVPNVGGGSEPIDLGSGETPKAVGVQLSSLALDTTYHYRFIATDPFIAPPGLVGDEPTFHTSGGPAARPDLCSNAPFRTGASANLPDCRAYEMVSPVAKGNTDIAVRVSAQNYPAGFEQSAADGNGLAFSSEKSFGGALGSPYTSQYLARRGAGGWSTQAISPPHGQELNEFLNIKVDAEYKLFSGDLNSGWFLHGTDAPLDECAVAGYPNLYRRTAGGGYETLTTAKPAAPQTSGLYWPELQGLSADGTHAVFRANGKLLNKAAKSTGYQLYEHVAGEECGELRLVSVLPGGSAATGASAGTAQNDGGETREQTVANAVSEDGSHIFWTAAAEGPAPLYVRIDGEKTVQLSTGPAQFWTASSDGSKAIYTIEENLFEFDVASEVETLIAGGSAGLAGASEDASRLYFVSKLQLGGEGEAGAPNLYFREGGTTRLVGTLAAGDLTIDFPFNGLATVNAKPIKRGTQTTADGGTFAFVSTASLTGYDNRDAVDGRPNVELFIYDAGSERLTCVSCNPSGERPSGREIEGENGQFRRVAAQMAPWPNDLYASHSLSAGGNRLFFDSFEALVPRDTNGREDVYEWERAGSAKECEGPELGAELYVPSAKGCLSLISSGQSPSDSEMVDATPNGSDVFFKTSSSLLPQDPGLIDIYDARVSGGFAPEQPPPSPCEGEACQSPPAPPNDPTPSSLAFRGAGNVTTCPKGKVRRRGHCAKKAKKKNVGKKKASKNRRAGR